MPKTVEVTLGGRKYTISEKVAGVGEKWREVLRECSVYKHASRLNKVITEAAHIINEGLDNLRPERVGNVVSVLPQLLSILTNSQDEINKLLFDYVPEMKRD